MTEGTAYAEPYCGKKKDIFEEILRKQVGASDSSSGRGERQEMRLES